MLFTDYIITMLSNCILINVPKKTRILLPPEKMYILNQKIT